MPEETVQLKVLLPTMVLLDEQVRKVVAEGVDGSFCLLPRHIDLVAALVAGVLTFERVEGGEEFLAVDRGVLTKVGGRILVSTRHAARSKQLGELRCIIEKQFSQLDERERKSRSAAAQLEAQMVRRFLEWRHG